MRLLVTRPEPDASRQAEGLSARGHEVLVHPLMRVEFLDAGRLQMKGVQAILATSRNGLRALARNEALPKAKRKQLFAVGTATAEMAGSLGFSKIFEGAGTADALGALVAEKCTPAKGSLLHLAGERLAADLRGSLERRGFTVQQPTLYRTVPVARLGDEVSGAMRTGGIDGVILMSPQTARIWVELASREGLASEAAKLQYFCLSQAIADGLSRLEPAHIDIAESPREDGLLALITRKTAH